MHLRCPHCHNPVELLPEQPLHDVSCPSCGSSFNLISGDATQTVISQSRMVGRFQLVEELGVGHFGSVWKARDPDLDRFIAIKIPRRENLEPQETELFLREARAAAQLRHPNIVSVHEVGRADDTVFIASDYVDGANLKQWLTSKRLTAREAAELCVIIAEALHSAHEAGVVHRDLKPGNILMDLMGRPHITDFGLAKRESGEITMTVEGQILGTPAYMSPEQARGQGHHADRRSDLYSLGVILFELLTGELPFRGETRMLIVQILKDEPPSPRKLNARIPRDLETITLKCLSKDPARRYATAADVAADLQRHLRGEPIHARPISQSERLVRWCGRNQQLAAMIVGIAIVLVIGTAMSSYFAVQAKTESKKVREQAEVGRRLLYSADMNLAQVYWEHLGVGQTVERLGRHGDGSGSNDLRGFEWFYWARRCDSTCLRTSGGMQSVAFSPDGLRVTSGATEINVYNFKDGDLTLRIGLQGSKSNCLAISPDGKRIVSGCSDGMVRVWDVSNGNNQFHFKAHDAVASVAFSLNGKWLATGGVDPGSPLKIWDISETPSDLAAYTPRASVTGQGNVTSVAFSSDSLSLASGSSDRTVKLWNFSQFETEGGRLHEKLTLKGHNGAVNCVAFSRDGRRIASGSDDRTVIISNSDDGQEIQLLRGHSQPVLGVDFHPDGVQLASASADETIKVWDSVRGQILRDLKGHVSQVTAVAFSPDGFLLASAGDEGVLRVWDTHTLDETLTLRGHIANVARVAFSPDGRWIASTDWDKHVKVWDAASGETINSWKAESGAGWNVAFSPDGHTLLSASSFGETILWDYVTGQQLNCFKGGSSSISPNGSLVAMGNDVGDVWAIDAPSGREMFRVKGHQGIVQFTTFSPDGRRLASAATDGTVKIRSVADGRELVTLNHGVDGGKNVNIAVFSPDGLRIASVADDYIVRIWDSHIGRRLLELVSDDGETTANTVSFSPDGQRIATGHATGEVRIWDAMTGQKLLRLHGHTDWVWSVTFSPDGTRLASASWDGTVRVWDARQWTQQTRKEQQARCLLNRLCLIAESRDDLIGAIDRNQVFSDEVRNLGRKWASSVWDKKTFLSAEQRIHDLFDDPANPFLIESDVIERIETDSNLRPHVRDKVMSLMHDFKGSHRHGKWLGQLRLRCWKAVVLPALPPEQIQSVLRAAEYLNECFQNFDETRRILGAAQYRANQYEKCVSSLQRDGDRSSLQPIPPNPMNLAFLAMAQFKLGYRNETLIEDLHSAMSTPNYRYDATAQAILREADALFANGKSK